MDLHRRKTILTLSNSPIRRYIKKRMEISLEMLRMIYLSSKYGFLTSLRDSRRLLKENIELLEKATIMLKRILLRRLNLLNLGMNFVPQKMKLILKKRVTSHLHIVNHNHKISGGLQFMMAFILTMVTME